MVHGVLARAAGVQSREKPMNVTASVLFYCPGIAFKRHAVPTLVGSVGPEQTMRIWEETLRLQKALAKKRPRYSFGLNLILRYMEWDCALYRAAQKGGIATDEAKRLVEVINWQVFGPITATSFKISRIRSSQLLKRVRWILDLMFGVVFTHPFRRNTFPGTDEIAFDVVICPLAKYFKDQGCPELTASAACGLDQRMADVWGMTLRRTQTIAEGYALCDFRFRAEFAEGRSVAQQHTQADSPAASGPAA